MKTSASRTGKPGFASYVLVLSTAAILTLLTLSAYRRAIAAHEVQGKVQLRADYSEKEDSVLRSIMAITPNRAMRAMRHNSNSSTTISNPLRWQDIFTEALVLANARTSISTELQSSLNITNLRAGNTGDSALTNPALIFKAANISGATNAPTGLMTAGCVVDGVTLTPLSGYPSLLKTSVSSIATNDAIYPIIADDKRAAGLAVGVKPNFNLLKYPQINFGYARPGEDFVAKKNWWAFSMNLAGHDAAATKLASPPARDYVLSIYEIPSQLAISASSFMSLGRFESGDSWQNVNIRGGVFGGKVAVEGRDLDALATRRGMTLSGDSTIDGRSFANSAFNVGAREEFYLTGGEFFPVSLASESGRVAFIPINRGEEFFDRFHDNVKEAETSTVSPTTWNNYSVGALQCAMRVDIAQVKGATNPEPTVLRFSYMGKGTTGRQTYVEPLITGIKAVLPPGYVKVANENQSYDFGTSVVDIAYGANGKFYFQTDISGSVSFTNGRFGDPIVGTFKGGYYRPSAPYKVKLLPSNKVCVAIYPQRIEAFLNLIDGATPDVNNSLLVNVDYTNIGPTYPLKPQVVPNCREIDYGVILQECADLSSFPKGFSLVTNLRTYIGEDFNIVPTTPPTGFVPAVTADNPNGNYYPPASLFAPEKRYGVEVDPYGVSLTGQVGSLAKSDRVNSSDEEAKVIRPLDSKNLSGQVIAANKIAVNLKPITHPAELPPITMMNWLVVLEERRKEN